MPAIPATLAAAVNPVLLSILLILATVLGCRAMPEQQRVQDQAPDPGAGPPAASHRQEDPVDPLQRAERLRLGTGPGRRAELVRALDDPDVLVRGMAVLVLTNDNAQEVLPLVAARAEAPAGGDGRAAARTVVLEALPDLPAALSAAVPVCSWASGDPSAAVRARAAAACAARPDADRALLESLARDRDWTVRARLAAALSRRREAPHAAAVLNVLARDVHRSVRRAALRPAPA